MDNKIDRHGHIVHILIGKEGLGEIRLSYHSNSKPLAVTAHHLIV